MDHENFLMGFFDDLSFNNYNFLSTELKLCKIERFCIYYRKTKTEAITLENHKGDRPSSEPIRARSKHMQERVIHAWVNGFSCDL